MVCGPPQIPAAEAAAALRLGAAQTGQVAPGVATVPVSYAYTHKMIQGVEVVEESCIPRSTESPVSPLCMTCTVCTQGRMPLSCHVSWQQQHASWQLLIETCLAMIGF